MNGVENVLVAFATGVLFLGGIFIVVMLCWALSTMSRSGWFRFLVGIVVVFAVGASIMEIFDLWA